MLNCLVSGPTCSKEKFRGIYDLFIERFHTFLILNMKVLIRLLILSGTIPGLLSQKNTDVSCKLTNDVHDGENNSKHGTCDDFDQVCLAKRVLKTISDTDKNIPPVKNQRNVKVPLEFKNPRVINVVKFDELQGSITTIFHVTVTWTDEIRRWNDSNDPKCIRALEVSQDKLWTPPLTILNYLDDRSSFGNADNLVRIERDGTASLEFGGKFQTDCTPIMDKFPFDVQTCSLFVYPAGYRYFELPIANGNQNMNINIMHTRNGQWDVQNAVIIYNGDIHYMEIVITIKRRSLYFTLNVIVPFTALCFLNPVVFFLPGESGDRIGLTITISLSFAVYLSMIAEVMPKTSEPLPTVIYFIFMSQVVSILIVILNIISTIIYAQKDDRKIPALFRCIHKFCRYIKSKCLKKETTKAMQIQEAMEISGENCPLEINDNEVKESTKTDDNNNDRLTWGKVGKTCDNIFLVVGYGFFFTGLIRFLSMSGWLE